MATPSDPSTSSSPAPGFIFIVANQYLRLYSVIKGKQLLDLLIEQKEHIFVTTQIVDEVERNKLTIARQFLQENIKKLDVNKFNVPDHLFDVSRGTTKELNDAITPVVKKVTRISELLEEATTETLERISKSQDEVSVQLPVLFGKCVEPTSVELENARARKEKGNRPGSIRTS